MKLTAYKMTTKRIKGVATIEFVGGFFAFWLMCMAWVEMSFMSYVSSLGDLAIANAAREVKRSDSDYEKQFAEILNQDNSLWRHLINTGNFKYSVHFVKNLEELTRYEDECLRVEVDEETTPGKLLCDQPTNHAIAVYRITYDYQPMFNFFLSSDTLFSREAIVIQEYQRENVAL
ncbi:pilus assembly protein [Vibrio sp. V31_P5A7T61]|uniref:TadE family protein n=1 Tax=unclassified Vibrio TaxID=2614977 RepID=UPI0013735760|nr:MULTISPECIES: TadE family protein [unclassified Vibrio]EKO3893393.1 pilus assembly protein [Vibrio metschnikovii]NAW62683.1 pilus assembly protein [Vibrio sp. V31_P5A7T61]NAX02669.1 pilus assembly protein [Vibrio sp. V34_P3A8T189]NAX62305.1 pilus assembly protein [Vibrio sp. V32_P6A28T40]